jgi:hypothetical protein
MHSISNPHNISYNPPTRQKPTGRLCVWLLTSHQTRSESSGQEWPVFPSSLPTNRPSISAAQRNTFSTSFFCQLFTILPTVKPCYLTSCFQWCMGGVVERCEFPVVSTRISHSADPGFESRPRDHAV